jgi:NADH-quinone oxidoreductase subunit L
MDAERVVEVTSWLVLILPLGGFIVLAFFGDWIRRDREESGAGILACGTVLAAFGLTIWMAVEFGKVETEHRDARGFHISTYRAHGVAPDLESEALDSLGRSVQLTPGLGDWIQAGELQVPIRLLVDRLALLMMLVVTGVGALIHVYSLGYMARDGDRVRYFAHLNLFTFFMLLLVLGGSLPLLFVGWEGVGLCSYLLIGFWFKKPSAAAAGSKAFIVNRVGDAGLLLGMLLAFQVFGTLDLVRILPAESASGFVRAGIVAQAEASGAEALGAFGPLTVIALLLFVGACGKSAQAPLHVWLPDAMEGPTPVSALIHAATMVTAGVYLLARLSPLYVKAPTAMLVVAGVGVFTAVMAGTIALVQTDIKRVLAYSTISQLGYMFLACGVGVFGAAVFHLFTHAFFKALLFLGAGSVIHALSGEQDMRRMGGLGRRLPWTFWTFLAGAAAIAGVPFLSGWVSKEEILAGTFAAGRPVLLVLALAAAGLTAFYMARLVLLTFFGSFRGTEAQRQHLHESPWVMRVPLVLLAVGALGAGYVGVPWRELLAVARGAGPAGIPRLLAPVLAEDARRAGQHTAGWLPYVATLLAAGAVVLAIYLYRVFADVPARLARRLAPLARALEAKWGFDIAYGWLVRRVVIGGSEAFLWRRLDAGWIDGAVNGTARLVESLAQRTRALQTGLVRAYTLTLFGGAVALLTYLVWLR